MSTESQIEGRNVVLLLEDQPLIRTAMAEALEAGGFEVVEASDSDEALERLNETLSSTSPSALLTDIDMPGGLNGCELAWRFHQRFPGTAILVVSDVAGPSDPGGLPPKARFLPRPTTPEHLLDSLYEALRELEVLPR
jgi:CheY-like chemotaxis protein